MVYVPAVETFTSLEVATDTFASRLSVTVTPGSVKVPLRVIDMFASPFRVMTGAVVSKAKFRVVVASTLSLESVTVTKTELVALDERLIVLLHAPEPLEVVVELFNPPTMLMFAFASVVPCKSTGVDVAQKSPEAKIG